jgi:DNA-binding response OmpR family regulator
MPGKDGIELLKELRAVSNIPVFLFTAYDDETTRKSAEFFKADKYFHKPIDFTELRENIHNIIFKK